MRTAAFSIAHRRHSTRPLPWLLLAGYMMAAVDLGIAARYWTPRGLSVERMLQSFAEWLLGASAYHGGAATALLGAAVYGLVLSGALLLFHALAARMPALVRHPWPSGAAFGLAAYVAIFHMLAPALTGRSPSLERLDWIAACVLVFTLAIGIPGALLSRALHGPHERARTDLSSPRAAGRGTASRSEAG